MKHRSYYILPLAFLFLLFPATAYANSSWRWISQTRPFDVLPFAVALTLLAEFLFLRFTNRIARPFFLFAAVCLANLASFLLPYAIYLNGLYAFEESLEHLPVYIVGLGYLFLTLVAELPVVYCSLRGLVAGKKRLLLSNLPKQR